MTGVHTLAVTSADLHVGGADSWAVAPDEMKQHQGPELSGRMTEQAYLGPALLTPHGEGPYKSGSKHCLPHHTLASRPRLERMPTSGTQNEEEKNTGETNHPCSMERSYKIKILNL